MAEVLVGVFSVVVGGLIGFLVTRWADRARFYVLLKGFDTVTKQNKDVECSEELARLSEKSWHMNTMRAGKIQLEDLVTAYGVATNRARVYENAKGVVVRLISDVEKASDDRELQTALREIIRNAGVTEAWQAAIYRSATLPAKPYQGEPKLHVSPSRERRGSWVVVWEATHSFIGGNLDVAEYLRERLEPVIQALKYLDKDVLLGSLRRLPNVIDEQLDIHRKIAQITTPIMDDQSRWIAEVLLANYGASSMILWPDARMIVTHQQSQQRSKNRYPLEASITVEDRFPIELQRLAPQDVENLTPERINLGLARPGAEATVHMTGTRKIDLEGFAVVSPGEQLRLWVVAKRVQADTPGGEAIRGHYKAGDAEAVVSLHITRPAPFGARFVRSKALKFSESQDLE